MINDFRFEEIIWQRVTNVTYTHTRTHIQLFPTYENAIHHGLAHTDRISSTVLFIFATFKMCKCPEHRKLVRSAWIICIDSVPYYPFFSSFISHTHTYFSLPTDCCYANCKCAINFNVLLSVVILYGRNSINACDKSTMAFDRDYSITKVCM